MGVRLPAAYQEVEYVQATGTQAFFTDVPIQDGLTVDSVQTFANGDNYLFGGNNGNVQICFNGTYNGRLQSSYNGYYYWTNGFDVQDNNTTKYHVVQTQRNGSQIGFLDDVQILNGTRSTTKDTSAGKTAALFGQRNASDALSLFYKGKVYSCKVSKDGTLLADFVPCYRKADGEIGMYDLVLQKFYVNEGTGVFLKGADVIDSISPWLVARRRMLMAQKPPVRLGDFTKAYVADIIPNSTTSWAITHNLGVLPKLLLLRMTDWSDVADGFVLDMMLDLQVPYDVGGAPGTIASLHYMWSGSTTSYQRANWIAGENVTTTSITLTPPYSTARSKYDTSKTYHIEIYG